MPSVRTERLRGLPRVVWVLLAGTLITRAGSFAVPFLTIYLHEERGLSTVYAGLALAAYGAGGIVAAGVGGALADRVGRRPVIVGAPALGGVALTLLVATQAPAAVLAVSFLTGAVSEAGRPAITALLADVVPAERRIDAFALFRLVINLGFAVGTGLGGLLITHFGFAKLFLADAATSWAYAVVALLAIPETRPAAAPAEPDEPPRGFRTALADPVFRRFLVATLITALVFVQPMATLGLVLTERGLSTAVFGALISLNGVVIITTEFWLSGVARRYRPSRVLALGSLFVGGGFALTGAVGTSIPLLVVTVVLWTFGEMLGSPTSQAYVAAIAPPDLRGRYSGALGICWSLAFTVGPVVGGVALLGGGLPLWTGTIVLSVFGAWLYTTLPDAAMSAPVAAAAGAPVEAAVPVQPDPRPVGRLLARPAKPDA